MVLDIGVGFCIGILTTILGVLENFTNAGVFFLLAWALNIVGPLGCGLYTLYVIIPIKVRRLHDTGKSGLTILWCGLGGLICGIGTIVMFVFMVLDSTPGDNQYGPNPKGSRPAGI